jgi:alkanesulfonate monooxygenase SsuD/methylene tetrahydromethanopterin reductase-like flavin-dependent oxidoreductase (luciferase family)
MSHSQKSPRKEVPTGWDNTYACEIKKRINMQSNRVIHPWVAESQIRIGVDYLGPVAQWDTFLKFVLEAEKLGFDSFWIADHPTILSDNWSILAPLAVSTQKIRLGTLVSCIYYRNPFLLARQAADVDRLSGGRLVLGLGIGDIAAEFEQLGLPYPSVRERQDYLEQCIPVIQRTWDSLPVGPVQQPYIPLLLAGGGARTMRQVAQYADVANFGPDPDTGGVSQQEEIERRYQQLDTHCATFGRPAGNVLRSHFILPLVLGHSPEEIAARQAHLPPAMRQKFTRGLEATPQQAIDYYNNLIKAGMRYFIIGCWPGDTETLRLFNQQVLPGLFGCENDQNAQCNVAPS